MAWVVRTLRYEDGVQASTLHSYVVFILPLDKGFHERQSEAKVVDYSHNMQTYKLQNPLIV